MRRKGEMGEEETEAMHSLVDRSEVLSRKIAGEDGSSDEDKEGGEERDVRELEELGTMDNVPTVAKGIMGMKFMLKLLGMERDSVDDIGDEVIGGNLGRRVYKPGQVKPAQTYSDISSTLKDSESTNSPTDTITPHPAASASQLPSLTPTSTFLPATTSSGPSSNPWLSVGSTSITGKIARESNAVETTKVQKLQAKSETERSKAREDAVVEIHMTQEMALSDAQVDQRKTKQKAPKETTNAKVDSAYQDSEDEGSNMDERAPTAFKQHELVAMAFAGDNVVEDFAVEKQRVIEEDAPKEVDTTLPGWGSWGGRGTKKSAPRPSLVKKIPGVDATKRTDAGKSYVIISERKDKKAAKYLVKDLPYPYTSKEQFARSMATPIGAQWNTRVVHQRATLPRVVKKVQAIVDRSGGLSNCIAILKAHSHKSALLALLIMLQIFNKYLDTEATAILLTNSKISGYQDRLADALESQDFTRFMEYSSNDLNKHESNATLVKTSKKHENFVADGFTGPYVGPAADLLFCYLKELDEVFSTGPREYYANMCSIFQSSGVGKSRAMLQLKEHNVIVVYMNIREHGRSEDGAPRPPRDDIPADILTKKLECSEDEYSDRCIAFLIGLFMVLAKCLEAYSVQYHSRDQIARAWSNDMCELKDNVQRTRFFVELKRCYKAASTAFGRWDYADRPGTSPLQWLTRITHAREAARQQSQGDMARNIQNATDNKKSVTTTAGEKLLVAEPPASSRQIANGQLQRHRPDIFGVSNLRDAYRRMLDSARTIFIKGEHAPQLVLAFDEADPLYKQRDCFLPSHIMPRAISEVSHAERTSPVWVVFASTASKVVEFGASVPLRRIYMTGTLTFPPYINFGWDQNAPSLEQLSYMESWSSMAQSDVSMKQVLDLAGEKLTSSVVFDPTDHNQVLAVIGQRFLLDICPGQHDSMKILQDGISSHLRICLGVSPDRNLIETAYPSEPLLSCAAATRLYPGGMKVRKLTLNAIATALCTVKTAVLGHTVARGNDGQLASRLVFLLSKDLATRRYQRQVLSPPFALSSDELLDCKPVPVTIFLEHTFGSAKLTEDSSTLLNGWYVNFSHWIAASESISFDGTPEEKKTQWKSWLLRNWTRTCAIQYAPLQHTFDKFTPMFNLGRLEKPGAAPFLNLVSFVLISNKAKKRGSGFTLDTDWLEWAKLPQLDQPYVAIVADLGLNSQEAVFTLESSLANPVLKIHASGLGRTTYPYLTEQLIEPLRKILAESIIEQPNQGTYTEACKRLNKQLRYGSSSKNADIVWENNKWSFLM
ncbi:U3 small nucleolar RNA-associated protein 14 [Ceratobasidium sp. AG-Ba]|nr:U3 small nucleolar RNA-associated protein 14 [Ceratobasidium sp. AG-Ba]